MTLEKLLCSMQPAIAEQHCSLQGPAGLMHSRKEPVVLAL